MPAPTEDRPWRGWYNKARWHRLRDAQLRRRSLCEMCWADNRVTIAVACDHIVPHKGDESLFWDIENLQSLCTIHHNATKQIVENRNYIPGASVSGTPTDPQHHWNK